MQQISHIFEKTNLNFCRGEAIPGGRRLIDDMPLSLQQDVTYEESKDVLEKVLLFAF